MAFHRTFTYQQLEEVKIKTYVKGLYDLFAHRTWTQQEWDEVVDRDVKVFLDEKQTRAQAAAKARKTKSSKTKKGQSKTAATKEIKKLLGPQPKGANTKCDTVLGKGMGKKKKDGSAYFIFPPLAAASRANWPHRDAITTKNSSFGGYMEEVLKGFWASPDPEHPSFTTMTDEQLIYYKLKEPSQPEQPPAKAAPVDELAGLSWLGGAKPVDEVVEEVVEDPTTAIKDAAQVAAIAVSEAFLSTEVAGNAVVAALEKKEAARARWNLLKDALKARPLVYKRNDGSPGMLSRMDMDALNANLFARVHINDAIVWKCKNKKTQKKAKKTESEMFTYWFNIWDNMNAAARQGDEKEFQKFLSGDRKAADVGIYEGMTQTDVLDKVFRIAFKKPLKKTKDHVTVSDTEIGEDALAEKKLEYAKECNDKCTPFYKPAKWVTDLLAADDEDSDSDDSDDENDF